MRNLLVGSEGTLGIITAAALKLFSRPQQMTTAFLKVASPRAALDLLSMLRDIVGEVISAYELIHAQGFSFLHENPNAKQEEELLPPKEILDNIRKNDQELGQLINEIEGLLNE